MLEKIMDLQILFCIMAASGASGAVGMLAVHLTYRRILRRTNAVTSLKEKWLNLWKTRDKLLNRMNHCAQIEITKRQSICPVKPCHKPYRQYQTPR